jgi:L-rhamnose isomerase
LVEHRAELPFGPVYDHLGSEANVPVGASWLCDVAAYEVKAMTARP